MQGCPCLRLSRLRVFHCNLRKPGHQIVAARRVLSQASSAAIAQKSVPNVFQSEHIIENATATESRSLNQTVYDPKDQAFWARYEELWGAAQDAVKEAHLGHQAVVNHTHLSSSREATTNVAKKFGKHVEANVRRRKNQGVVRDVRGIRSLKDTCSPEDWHREKKIFLRWKMDLAKTRELLEASQIPKAAYKTRALQGLMRSGQRETGAETVKDAWLKLSLERRQCLWPALMISALRSLPDRAHEVFVATFDAVLVRSYVAQDIIEYLVWQHTSSPLSASIEKASAEHLCHLLKTVLEKSPADYLHLRQSTLYQLLNATTSLEALSDLYQQLLKHNHPLHKHTRLQFASRLAKSSAHKMRAVEILKDAVADAGLDINTPQGASLCTLILSLPEADITTATTQSASTPAEVFEHLLRCGLEPNVITYTTIIRELCLRQELAAAEDVLQLMLKSQIEPDAYVYSTVMNGAKLCGHVSMVCQLAETAAARSILQPILWNDFLQAIHLTAAAEARDNRASKQPRVVPSFPLMLQAYSKLFQLGPLHTLLPGAGLQAMNNLPASSQFRAKSESVGELEHPGATVRPAQSIHLKNMLDRWEFSAQLAPAVQRLPQLLPDELLEPTSGTLITMIFAYIRGLSNPYDVIAFYSHFRRLVQIGKPVVVELLANLGTAVHDVVIMSLCEYEGMLRAALDVVGDMLRDATLAAEQDPGLAQLHPPPSVHTWSILLNGFMFHRQTKQGERLLHMMRERGIEPNLVTWNTLMAGYARLQNVKQTARSLQRLEQSGFEPDEFTFRAFSYLGDKASVLRHLQTRRMKDSDKEGKVARLLQEPTYRSALPSLRGVASEIRSKPGGGGVPLQSFLTPKPVAENFNNLRKLDHEVEAIARMMDEEQRDTGALQDKDIGCIS